MSDEEIRRLDAAVVANILLEMTDGIAWKSAADGNISRLTERLNRALAGAPASTAPDSLSQRKRIAAMKGEPTSSVYASPAPALTGDKLKEIANRHGSLSRGYFLIFDWDAIVQDPEFPR